MATGVQMGNNAFEMFTRLSKKASEKTADGGVAKLTWHLFKLGQEDGKGPETIIPAEKGMGKVWENKEAKAEAEHFKATVWAEMAGTLTKLKEPRFGVVDLWHVKKDGEVSSKLVFFRWSPDTAAVAHKMKYAGGEASFKSKTQAAKVKQCNDASDVTLDEFVRAM